MCTTGAEHAFQILKDAFTSVPILQHLDPEKTFTVEVDASDTDVGTILSQCFGDTKKMHPIAFSQKYVH